MLLTWIHILTWYPARVVWCLAKDSNRQRHLCFLIVVRYLSKKKKKKVGNLATPTGRAAWECLWYSKTMQTTHTRTVQGENYTILPPELQLPLLPLQCTHCVLKNKDLWAKLLFYFWYDFFLFHGFTYYLIALFPKKKKKSPHVSTLEHRSRTSSLNFRKCSWISAWFKAKDRKCVNGCLALKLSTRSSMRVTADVTADLCCPVITVPKKKKHTRTGINNYPMRCSHYLVTKSHLSQREVLYSTKSVIFVCQRCPKVHPSFRKSCKIHPRNGFKTTN